MALSTVTQTLQKELNDANPGTVADCLRQMQLGDMLTPTVYTSGTITGIAAVPLPSAALIVMSARVVTSATGASVGTYICADAGVTPLLPPGGASAAVGIAALAADGTTITFPNTVTSVVITYMPRSAVAMSTLEQPAS